MIFGNIFPLSLILTILYFIKYSKHCKKDLEDRTSSTGQVYGVDKNERYCVYGIGQEKYFETMNRSWKEPSTK